MISSALLLTFIFVFLTITCIFVYLEHTLSIFFGILLCISSFLFVIWEGDNLGKIETFDFSYYTSEENEVILKYENFIYSFPKKSEKETINKKDFVAYLYGNDTINSPLGIKFFNSEGTEIGKRVR